MNYGYILQKEKTEHKTSFFRMFKTEQKEMYKTHENLLNFFYLPYTTKKRSEEKAVKKLIKHLKQEKTDYIAFAPDLLKLVTVFKAENFYVIDGSTATKHLLVQALFSYQKTKADVQKSGIHICADNMNDISFFFDQICKIDTTFSMCTENAKFHENILKKYGIAVHFSDNVYNKIIVYYNGTIPRHTNSHLIDLSLENYKITCEKYPDLFQKITPVEVELLIRMCNLSFNDEFHNSGIKTACF